MIRNLIWCRREIYTCSCECVCVSQAEGARYCTRWHKKGRLRCLSRKGREQTTTTTELYSRKWDWHQLSIDPSEHPVNRTPTSLSTRPWPSLLLLLLTGVNPPRVNSPMTFLVLCVTLVPRCINVHWYNYYSVLLQSIKFICGLQEKDALYSRLRNKKQIRITR